MLAGTAALALAIFSAALGLWGERPAARRDGEPMARWPRDPEIDRPLREFLNARPERVAAEGFHRGIALGLYSKNPRYDYGPLIDEIAAHGANWVSLQVELAQRDAGSTAMEAPMGEAAQERVIARAVRQARERGLKAMLFPIVLLSHPGPKEWRGKLKPADRAAWFGEYRGHLLRLARLARRSGAEALCVGSELCSLEEEAGRWSAIIADCRAEFPGMLLYSANWDHYERAPFWAELDAIGLSGYYELTKSSGPTLEDLTQKWESIRDGILRWRRDRALAAPIVFTEIGYANQVGAGIFPWDHTRVAPPDPAAQALCLESFIRAWHGQPGFGGAYIYNWFGYARLDDAGYSPRGKPAARIILAWNESIESAARKRMR